MAEIDALMRDRDRRIDELHRSEPGRTAMLVIDMQCGFLEPGAALEVAAGRDVVPNVQRLIAACRQKGVPVIYTEFVYATQVPCLRGDPFGWEHLPAEPGAAKGFGRPSNNCLIGPQRGQGPDSADTIDALAPRPDELIVRAHTYDKFYGTPLDLALRSRDIRQLIVTGVTTDVCVNATLMSATAREYRTTAVTDGMATVLPELHEACLKIWHRKFARLATTQAVLDELEAM